MPLESFAVPYARKAGQHKSIGVLGKAGRHVRGGKVRTPRLIVRSTRRKGGKR